jgi:hypothetical protein
MRIMMSIVLNLSTQPLGIQTRQFLTGCSRAAQLRV